MYIYKYIIYYFYPFKNDFLLKCVSGWDCGIDQGVPRMDIFFSEKWELKSQCSFSGLTFRMVAMKCNNYPLLQLLKYKHIYKMQQIFSITKFWKRFSKFYNAFVVMKFRDIFRIRWKCKNWNYSDIFPVLKSMFNCQIISFFSFL